MDCHGPRSRLTHMRRTCRYEAELATEAVASIEDDKKDPRPQALIRVEGHLFDKGVLNRLIDIAVDSPCDFEVCFVV